MIALSLLVIASAFGIGDDANWVRVGSAGNFGKNPYVQMKSETVEIQLADRTMHVHANFWFINHGPKTVAMMAYPDETSGLILAGNQNPKDAFVIDGMVSTVDGRRVRLTRMSVNTHDPENVKSIWLKKVAFESGQMRKVEVDYHVDNGFAGNNWVFNSYILKTGASWSGNIENCKIIVDWTRLRKISKPQLMFRPVKGEQPGTWERLGWRKSQVILTNIKPTYDLNLRMVRGFWNFMLNGKPVGQGAGTSDFVDEPAKGSPSDIQIDYENFLRLFGETDPWSNDDKLGFLGPIEFPDRRTVMVNGRKYHLARRNPGRSPLVEHEMDNSYIHLKDFVIAIGGTYKYDRADDRIDITVPVPKKTKKD